MIKIWDNSYITPRIVVLLLSTRALVTVAVCFAFTITLCRGIFSIWLALSSFTWLCPFVWEDGFVTSYMLVYPGDELEMAFLISLEVLGI